MGLNIIHKAEKQHEHSKPTLDIANIDKQAREDQIFFQGSEEDRKAENKHQEQSIVELKERLLKDNLGFLERLEASPVGKKLLLKIEEKRNAFLSEVNIDQYKEFLPHCIQHGLPIQVIIPTDQTNRTSKNSLELENLLKEFDAIIANMKTSEIEMIKSLVTLIKLGDAQPSFNREDGSLEVNENRRLELDLRTVFEHEFTHLKEDYLCIADPDFHLKLEKINSDIDMSNLDIVRVGLCRPIWKSEVREYDPASLDEHGDVVRKSILNDGTIIEQVFAGRSGRKEDFYVNSQLLTPEIEKDLMYRTSLTEPKDGFINPYAKTEKGYNDNSYLLLKEFIPFDIEYPEELTTITETYYDDPAYFSEIFFQSKTGESIPLNEKYDHLSDFPALRKKLRLMIEYGFFPDGDFTQYFEKE